MNQFVLMNASGVSSVLLVTVSGVATGELLQIPSAHTVPIGGFGNNVIVYDGTKTPPGVHVAPTQTRSGTGTKTDGPATIDGTTSDRLTPAPVAPTVNGTKLQRPRSQTVNEPEAVTVPPVSPQIGDSETLLMHIWPALPNVSDAVTQ